LLLTFNVTIQQELITVTVTCYVNNAGLHSAVTVHNVTHCCGSVLLGWTSAGRTCLGLGRTGTSCWIVWPQIWHCVCGMYVPAINSADFIFFAVCPLFACFIQEFWDSCYRLQVVFLVSSQSYVL